METVRIEVISCESATATSGAAVQARCPRGQFAPAPGSPRSVVRIGEHRFRNIQLVWKDSIARCSFVVPRGARGKRLTIGLTATVGGSRARTSYTFRIS